MWKEIIVHLVNTLQLLATLINHIANHKDFLLASEKNKLKAFWNWEIGQEHHLVCLTPWIFFTDAKDWKF